MFGRIKRAWAILTGSATKFDFGDGEGYQTFRHMWGDQKGWLISSHIDDLPPGSWEALEGSVYQNLDKEVVEQAEIALLGALPGSALRTISGWMDEDPENWPHTQEPGWHFYGGMAVRNELRHLGFGEDRLRVMNLDDCYIDLLVGAVRRASEPRGGG